MSAPLPGTWIPLEPLPAKPPPHLLLLQGILLLFLCFPRIPILPRLGVLPPARGQTSKENSAESATGHGPGGFPNSRGFRGQQEPLKKATGSTWIASGPCPADAHPCPCPAPSCCGHGPAPCAADPCGTGGSQRDPRTPTHPPWDRQSSSQKPREPRALLTSLWTWSGTGSASGSVSGPGIGVASCPWPGNPCGPDPAPSPGPGSGNVSSPPSPGMHPDPSCPPLLRPSVRRGQRGGHREGSGGAEGPGEGARRAGRGLGVRGGTQGGH